MTERKGGLYRIAKIQLGLQAYLGTYFHNPKKFRWSTRDSGIQPVDCKAFTGLAKARDEDAIHQETTKKFGISKFEKAN